MNSLAILKHHFLMRKNRDGREDSVSLNIRRFHDTQDLYDQNIEQIYFLAESGKTLFCSNFESGLWIYLLYHFH